MGIFSRFERGMEDGLEGAAGKLFNAPITPVQISKKAERAMHREKMVGAGKQYAPTLYTVLVNPQDDTRLFGYYPTLAGETETYLSAKAAEQGFLMDGQPLVRFIVDEGLRRGRFDVVAELVSAPIIAQLRQEEMRRYGLATRGSNRSQVATQTSARNAAQASRDAQPYRNVQPYRYDSRGRNVAPVQPTGVQAPLSAQAAANPYAFADPYAPANAYAPDAANRSDEAPAQRRRRRTKKEPLPFVPEEEIDRSIDYGEYTFNSQDWDSYQKHGPSSMPLFDSDDLPGFDEEEAGFDLQREHESAAAVSTVEASHAAVPAKAPSAAAPAHAMPAGIDDLPSTDSGKGRRNSLDLLPSIHDEEEEKNNSLDFLPDISYSKEKRDSLDLLPNIDQQETYGDGDISGIDVAAYNPSHSDSFDFAEPDYVESPMQVPNTAMFAAGAAEASAAPNYNEVRARLINPAGTRSIDLASNRLIIGRSSSCDIMIDDINASRNHAELQCDLNGDWLVNDLGSTNGTLVNGRRITTHRLFEGDHIRIGTTDFIFTLR